MSIVSEAESGKITWLQAGAQILAWGQKLIAADPAATAAVAALQSTVKQGVSDAIGRAEGYLSKHTGPMTATIEAAADTALAGATKGLSVPFNDITNHGIETIVNAGVAALQAWGLEAQAKLAPTAPPAK
jgi:hypothetical protein